MSVQALRTRARGAGETMHLPYVRTASSQKSASRAFLTTRAGRGELVARATTTWERDAAFDRRPAGRCDTAVCGCCARETLVL